MTAGDFQDQLARRASAAGVALFAGLAAQLESYYRLLAHWNATVNLTALPLDRPSDQTIDRLLIEPVAAGRLLSMESGVWLDLGSGSGSPAIPLTLAKPAGRLTMVESRERKAAFLREAIRALDLKHAEVEATRIEAVAADHRRAGSADLITVRAVRLDPSLFASIGALLRLGGRVLLFGAKRATLTVPRGFEETEAEQLGSGLVFLTRTGP